MSMNTKDPFAELVTLDRMPSAWQGWRNKIFTIIGLDPSKYLKDQPYKKPLLLIPEKEELETADARELLGIINYYLCSVTNCHTSSLFKRLESLHPESSIPLLYAMRYVAFQDAKSRYYWPEFCKQILMDKFDYQNVAPRVASITSTLWLNLYQYTGGRLYYPKEGPRHIKWPLAHAGLIPSHKKSLKEFGLDLASIGYTELEETLKLEVDEFLLRLEDWLISDNERASSSLFLVLSARGPSREIIAELGLHWLKAKQNTLLEEAKQKAAIATRRSVNLIRRNLFYDEERNMIFISFSPGRTKGQPKLLWNNQEYTFQTQYLARNEEYISLALHVPLINPEWPSKAFIQIGDTTQFQITIPSLDKNKGLVFQLDNGNQTKRWSLGQQYYVLVPSHLFQKKQISKIFSEWLLLQSPNNWQQYYLLLVRTRNPTSNAIENTIPIIVLEELEENAELLGLPSFGHQYQAKLMLFGGELANLCSKYTSSQFASLRPPFVEITGIWGDELEITLSYLNHRTGQYEQISKVIIDKNLSGKNPILEVIEGNAEVGEYRLSAGDEIRSFSIINKEEPIRKEVIPTFDLDCWFQNNEGVRIIKASRKDIDSLTIYVHAWPLASLTLLIKGTAWEKTFEVLIDSDGNWNQSFINLGVDVEQIPKGEVCFTISWNGFIEKKIHLYDEDVYYIPTFHTNPSPSDDKALLVNGILNRCTNIKFIFGCFIPIPPWKSDFRSFVFMPKSNKELKTDADKPVLEPKWIILTDKPKYDEFEYKILGVGEVQNTQPIINDRINIGDYSKQWSYAIKRIMEIPHPASLEPYVSIDPVMRFIHSYLNGIHFSGNYVLLNLSSQSELLASRLLEGLDIYMLLPPIINTKNARNCSPYKIKLLEGNENIFQVVRNFNEGKNISIGKVIPIGDQGEVKFIPSQAMKACLKCRLIHPANEFVGHHAAYLDFPDCTEMGMKFQPLVVGQPYQINVAIYTNPIDTLCDIRRLLVRLVNNDLSISNAERIWLLELRKAIPANIDRREWLENLIIKIELFSRVMSDDTAEIRDLDKLSFNFEAYQEGLIIVFKRVVDQIKSWESSE